MKISSIIISIVSLCFLALSGFAITQAIQLKKMELRNSAVDGCGNLAVAVKKGEFIPYVYNLCLSDKGQK